MRYCIKAVGKEKSVEFPTIFPSQELATDFVKLLGSDFLTRYLKYEPEALDEFDYFEISKKESSDNLENYFETFKILISYCGEIATLTDKDIKYLDN